MKKVSEKKEYVMPTIEPIEDSFIKDIMPKEIIFTTKKLNYFRNAPTMASSAIVKKAPENTSFVVRSEMTTSTVKFYLLDNGYYVSTLEQHMLSGK